MLDIQEIEDTIEELENGNTTYDSIIKLAALYSVRKELSNKSSDNSESKIVIKELNDILPMYNNYCVIKKKFQLNELPKETLFHAMQDVCKELDEFIQTLYNNTYSKEERENIKNMLEDLINVLE